MSSTYLSSSFTFYSDKIVSTMEEYPGEEVIVMMDWEHPIMSASAAYVTEGGGASLTSNQVYFTSSAALTGSGTAQLVLIKG